MENRANNTFLNRIRFRYKETALRGRVAPCASEISSCVDDFFYMVLHDDDVYPYLYEDYEFCWKIESICEAVMNIALSTRKGESLNNEEVFALKQMIEELGRLYKECVRSRIESTVEDKEFVKMMNCVCEIIEENMKHITNSKRDIHNYRNEMLFKRYEDLWRVIDRIIYQWDELCEKGFSIEVFYNFVRSYKYEKKHGILWSDNETINKFMGILNGTLKFVPAYEMRFAYSKIVDKDAEDKVILKQKRNI